MKLDLSQDQTAAMVKLRAAFMDPASREFRLGGLAGTGKTTLVRFIKAQMEDAGVDCLVVAPTAKACVALARRGIERPMTIHQAIYTYLGTRVEHVEGERKVTMDFELKPEDKAELCFRFEDSRRSGIVIVDESSMVNLQVANDLRARAPWILWVGDHGQLMPVGQDPGIMSNIDARLETIHRQAAGSPIIALAHAVRGGAPLSRAAVAVAPSAREAVVVRPAWNAYGLVSIAIETRADLVIVARNATRASFNREMRSRLYGALPPPLVVGEKLVGLRNNYRDSVFNGETYVVRSFSEARSIEGRGEIDVVLEAEGREPFATTLWREALGPGIQGREIEAGELPQYLSVLDYAYALTCHKAQGSEAARVLVFDEKVERDNWDPKRWGYTAATRAKEFLCVASPEVSP